METYTEDEPDALDAVQLGRLFDAMRRTEPRLFPLFACIALTGLRFGEASALE